MRQILVLLALVMLVTSCTTKNEPGNTLINEPVTVFSVRSNNNIEWSPDDTRLLFESGQYDSENNYQNYLTLFEVETGNAVNLYEVMDYAIISYDWNPANNNQFVLTTTYPDQSYFNIGDLESKTLVRIGSGYASQWLGDGTGILVHRNDTIGIYDIESGELDPQTNAVALSVFPDYQKDNFNIGAYLHYDGEESSLIIQNLDGIGSPVNLGRSNGSGIWSPDSQRLAVKRYETSPHDYSLLIFSLFGDQLLQIQADQETSFSWSPNGEFLVTDNWDGEIFIIDIEQGTETLIANGYNPSWSPNGNQIAFINSETFALEFFNASSLIN